MTNYPIGDYLIRLKNACMAENKVVSVDSSKLIASVAEILKKEGFLSDIALEDGILKSTLAFHKKSPLMIDLKLVSKPGLRVYRTFNDLKKRKRRRVSTLIISTNKGVMSSDDAIKAGVGGEVLAEIW